MFDFVRRLFQRPLIQPEPLSPAERHQRATALDAMYGDGCQTTGRVQMHRWPVKNPESGALCQCGKTRY